MDIRKFGKIFRQINKVPISYNDDRAIGFIRKIDDGKNIGEDKYYYNQYFVPIFYKKVNDSERQAAIENIDIIKNMQHDNVVKTYTSVNVPRFPIVICDKVIDNEELFATRNDVGPKYFIENFNNTLLHYFTIKVEKAQRNNINNESVKTFKKYIIKLQEWFEDEDIDHSTIKSFIDEDTAENNKENKLIWEGATWSITFNNKTKTVKDTIGILIIAHLIKCQGDIIRADKIYCDVVADIKSESNK